MANDVKLTITADDKTKAAVESVQASLKRLETSTGGLKSSFEGVSMAFRSLVAAAPFIALANEMRKVVSEGEELLKISQQIGVSVENLSGLKYAAELSETNIAELTVGFKGLAKALTGVSDDGKDTTQILKALGVTAKDPYDALLQIADAFSKMKDGAGKTSIALNLFGKSGLAVIPLLNEGSAGIREMHEEAGRLGIVISEKTAKKFDEFGDNIVRLKNNLSGLAITISNSVIPAVNKLFYLFSDKGAADLRLASIQSQLDSLHKIVDSGKFLGFKVSASTIEYHRETIKRLEQERADIIKRFPLPGSQSEVKTDAPNIAGSGFVKPANNKKAVDPKDTALKILISDTDKWEQEAYEAQQKDWLDGWKDVYQEKEKATKDLIQKTDEWEQQAYEAQTAYELADWKDKAKELFGVTKDVSAKTSKAFDGVRMAIEGMSGALADFVMTGKMDFKSLADSIIRDLIRIEIQNTMTSAIGGGSSGSGSSGWIGTALSWVGGLFSASANGNVFDMGRLQPFAYGGIVDRPTIFPMARGAGLMGEAGPEAVMPLKRGADGKLGVSGGGSAGSTIIIINANDAKSFDDMCRRNPESITRQVLQSLRDNKTNGEFKALTGR